MTHTREEVVAAAQRLFGESQFAEVLVALDAYGAAIHEREVHRVHLAILHLSEGQEEKLHYWIKTAKVDYRDPLAAQSLGPQSPEAASKLQAEAKDLMERWGTK